MTLSNFDWTDKQSLKWFLMLPTGHEGPYSLDTLSHRLSQQKLGADIKVWAEGLTDPLALKEVLQRASGEMDDIPPPLPPLPIFDDADEGLPSLPVESAPEIIQSSELKTREPLKRWQVLVLGSLLVMSVLAFMAFQWIKDQEKFSIRRYPKMSLEVHSRIQENMSFQGWDKKIFFKEFVSIDLTHIWLINAGYQACKVEAQFSSMPDKLLTFKDISVKFKTQSQLQNHVAEFTRFEFSEGTKIVPGMYQMQVKASDCHWDGIVPKLANKFSSPDKVYEASMKVVLFEKGAGEFQKLLDELNAKKLEKQMKEKGAQEQFWEDLQQKLQTLQAITLQIEQLLLDFVDKGAKDFSTRLKPMVNNYTRQFGHFLTNFVVANEKYFQEISAGELRSLTLRKNYESMIRLTSKNIGQAAMMAIEDFQKMKNPDEAKLNAQKKKIVQNFKSVKDSINSKLIEVTEDRSLKP